VLCLCTEFGSTIVELIFNVWTRKCIEMRNADSVVGTMDEARRYGGVTQMEGESRCDGTFPPAKETRQKVTLLVIVSRVYSEENGAMEVG
jgi:hypothetical protein